MTTTLDPADELATFEDVASLTRSSRRTVERKVQTGEFPCHRIGGRIRFTPDDVVQILLGACDSGSPGPECPVTRVRQAVA